MIKGAKFGKEAWYVVSLLQLAAWQEIRQSALKVREQRSPLDTTEHRRLRRTRRNECLRLQVPDPSNRSFGNTRE